MSTALVFPVLCNYCSLWRKPDEVTRLACGAVMCWQCRERHLEGLMALAGEPPRACHGCGVSYEVLEELSADGNVRMVVCLKDGVYQVLCPACSASYIPKRVDLVKGTAFGWRVHGK
jgi:hypothetical protein